MSKIQKNSPLRTVTRLGGLDLSIEESFNVHSIAKAMRDAQGQRVAITVLSSSDLGLKVVA